MKRALLLLTMMLVAAPLLAAQVNVGEDLALRGMFLTLVSIFVGGVLVSLTPCLYPMIPITLSVIGAHSAGQKPINGFLRSAVFVLGIAVVYTAIGLITSSMGVGFQRLLQLWWYWLFLSVFFGAMGLSMLGLFELQLPASFTSKLQGKTSGKGGFVGAFLVGLVTGVAASPCGSPMLAGLAVFAAGQAKEGRMFQSGLMFFTYALGIGALFMVLGTFPSLIKSIPKSGGWMEDVRKFLGVVLIGVALHYLQQAFREEWMIAYWILVAIVLALGAAAVAARAGFRRRYPALLRAWQLTALALAGAAVWVAVAKVPESLKSAQTIRAAGVPAPVPVVEPNQMMEEAQQLLGDDATFAQRSTAAAGKTVLTTGGQPTGVSVVHAAGDGAGAHAGWFASEAEGFAKARELGKPVIVDFGASWCAACKELEKHTFPDPAVAAAMDAFVKVRIDASDLTDEVEALQEKYSAQTLPTVAFLTADGKQLSKFDLKEFEKPAAFLKRLEQVKASLAAGGTSAEAPAAKAGSKNKGK